MGYRSDITIAITKELYVKCQLLQNIPAALTGEELVEKDGVCYWFLTGWKWYDSYPEVHAILVWFHWCEDEDENPPHRASVAAGRGGAEGVAYALRRARAADPW